MADNVIDQVAAQLRQSAAHNYPAHAELRNVRVVGHTPKTDHYIYDIVMDFADGSERAAAKVYRASRTSAPSARNLARVESENLNRVHAIFEKKGLVGVPRPLGDFTELGAVVAEKFSGVPLQSIIMKAALLPGYGTNGSIALAARKSGDWLRSFQKATSDGTVPFDAAQVLVELEQVCQSCRGEGLDENAIRIILNGAKSILARSRKTMPASAVLNDFTPLNVIIGDKGIGVSDYARMSPRGTTVHDVANFLACIEALEKYPFCNRGITSEVQQEFCAGCGVSAADQALLRVLKMKILLGMFAQGRTIKESAVRKKVMWATVMKRFIQQAANRTLAPAA
jgi:hypothetical protein